MNVYYKIKHFTAFVNRYLCVILKKFLFFTEIYMIEKHKIQVIPLSSKSEILGSLADGTIKIKLKSPPFEGRANAELIKLLSKFFSVPKSQVKIIKGLKSKKKIIEISK